jgi:hypothetical protein
MGPQTYLPCSGINLCGGENNMEIIKRKQPDPFKSFFHRLPNEIVVPSPFTICPSNKDPGYHKKPLNIRYGDKTKMRIHGQIITTKDQDVFIALTQIAKEQESLTFATHINELVRKLQVPYAETSKERIRKSLVRLHQATFEMIYNDGKESWVIFGLLNKAVCFEDDKLLIEIEPIFQRIFGARLMTSFIPDFRLGLKSQVARQLYLFYQRQRSASREKKHNIGLKKLCMYIQLGMTVGYPLFKKRSMIRRGFDELLDAKYLYKYKIDRNDVVHVWFDDGYKDDLNWPEKEKRIVEREKAGPPPELKQSKLPAGVMKVEDLERDINYEFNSEKERYQVQRNLIKIKAVFNLIANQFPQYSNYRPWNAFVEWLNDQRDDWLKTISAGTFNPTKYVFNTFIQHEKYRMPSRENIEREFKKLTESPAEKKKRLESEEQERRAEERKRREKEQEQREYEQQVQWAVDCVQNNFRDLDADGLDGLPIKKIRSELERKFPNEWKKVFEQFVRAVERQYQENKYGSSTNRRANSYRTLFRCRGKLWDDLF